MSVSHARVAPLQAPEGELLAESVVLVRSPVSVRLEAHPGVGSF